MIIAFGHPDNVFSLCAHLSQKTDLTLVYVLSGKTYQSGILSLELNDGSYGLQTHSGFFKANFPKTVVDFVGDNHKVWVLKVPSLKLLNLNNLKIYLEAVKKLRRKNFDIVHYNGFSPFIYLFYLGLKKRAAQFWTLHDYKHHSGEKKVVAERINQQLARLKDLTIIQHYEYLRKKVIEAFTLPPDKVRTLLSGSLDVFNSFPAKYELCPSQDYILFFGRISRYKGVDLLLEAYHKIEMKKPQLVIAGKGEFWFDTAPYLADPNILFINKYIRNEELIGLIERSRFIVVPYRDATHSAVIATAYALNKPVVASDVDGLKEVVFDHRTGRLVTPDSPGQLRATLEELIQNPQDINAYTANIIQEKETGKIAWNTITDHYLDLYAERLNQQ